MTDVTEVFSELWGELDEGLHTIPPSEAPNLTGESNADAATQMVQWFFENFEDPAQHTPRDTGKYVWIWGGPYDARDELDAAFCDTATQTAIEAAVEVEAEGVEWAPSSRRVQPDVDAPRLRVVKYRVLDVFNKWHRARGATEQFNEAWAAVPAAGTGCPTMGTGA